MARLLLKFEATWCHPCKVLQPVLDQIAQEQGITLRRTDVDQHREDARAWDVTSVPTTILLGEDGEVLARVTGAKPKALMEKALGL